MLKEIEFPPRPKPYLNIFGAIMHDTIGDFTDQVLYCSSVKELTPNSRLDVYYRPDRPYKQAIIAMAPSIDQAWPAEKPLPVNMFDVSSRRLIEGPPDWYKHWTAQPDLMLLPSNCTFNHMAALPRIARLQVPNRDHYEAELRERVGDSWYIVLHYREVGYEFRDPTGIREANLEQIPAIVDRVIEQGGQVVRIGHPEMVDLEPRPGFIDFKSEDFFLQAHAIARARCFFEASQSGPASLALAQGVPTARCNAIDLRCIKRDQGLIVPQHIIHESGKDVTRELIETHQLDIIYVREHPELSYRLLDLSKLLEALDQLLELTRDSANGWRDDTPPPPRPTIPGFYPGSGAPLLANVIF